MKRLLAIAVSAALAAGGLLSAAPSTASAEDGTLAENTQSSGLPFSSSAYVSPSGISTTAVSIPDSALRECINRHLGNPSSSEIQEWQTTSLKYLTCNNESISDLTGMEKFTKLDTVYLDNNHITDVSPVRPTTYLYVRGQTVTLPDIDLQVFQPFPVKSPDYYFTRSSSQTSGEQAESRPGGWVYTTPGTREFEWRHTYTPMKVYLFFYFSGTFTQTALPDNSPEVAIPDHNLRSCINSKIGQVSSATVTELQAKTVEGTLDCENKEITDLTGLEKFQNLETLELGQNKISDLSALKGLTKLTKIAIWVNRVSDVSPLAGLTNLKLLHAEGQDIRVARTTVGTAQSFPITNLNSNAVPLTSDTAAFDESSSSWSFSTEGEQRVNWRVPLTDATGPFTLQFFSGTIRQYVLDGEDTAVTIPDPALRACVGAELGVDPNQPIMRSQAAQMTALTCPGLAITSLSGLEAFAELRQLAAQDNQITDVSPLAGLTHLDWVYLWNNQITDMSPLDGLTSVTRLWAEVQVVDLENVAVGAKVTNPLINLDGSRIVAVSHTATVDEHGDWAFNTAGNGSLSWRDALGGALPGQYFSGTITQTATEPAETTATDTPAARSTDVAPDPATETTDKTAPAEKPSADVSEPEPEPVTPDEPVTPTETPGAEESTDPGTPTEPGTSATDPEE